VKLHHPVFLCFLGSIETAGGFQLLGELAFPFPSCDIFFPLPDGHSSFRQDGTLRCSTSGLSNNNGRHKISCHTTGIRFLVKDEGQHFRFVIAPALQKAGKHGKKQMPHESFRLFAGLVFRSPKG